MVTRGNLERGYEMMRTMLHDSSHTPSAAETPGVMEGGGSYNKHAKLPAGGAALALPLLEMGCGVYNSTPAITPWSSPIMDLHKGKTRCPPCGLH